MSDPEYLLPQSVAEALSILAREAGQARVIAGGTDVLPLVRAGKLRPRCLVDISRIPGLDRIEITAGFIEVGATVTFAGLKDSPLISRHAPALADAARAVGCLAIQNAATWAGNIVQAMPAADGAIIALALRAEARVEDGAGAEWRPVESLFLGPGRPAIDPTRQLISRLRFPLPADRWGSAWTRFGPRPSLVLPILNCAVCLGLDPTGQRVERATIALGPVAPRPFRARQAELFLAGQPVSPDSFGQAAQLVQQEANPRDSIFRASRAYRLSVIPPLVETALQTAASRAGADLQVN